MSQIFKKNFSKKIIYDFLDEFCDKSNNFYIFTKTTFKKIKLQNMDKLNKFYDTLKPFYFNSKIFYLERDKTYKNFITILRQITKYHHIPYTSKIVYLKSTYEIKYFISLH
tara:strand:+ start:89 stop:421 length:333 start_codon:yes stop_codon:yes gene_type:complete